MVLVGLIFTALGAIVYAGAREYQRNRRVLYGYRWLEFCAEWKRVGRNLGLKFGAGDAPGLVKLFGKLGGHEVLVETKLDTSVSVPVLETTRFQVLVPGIRIQRLEGRSRGGKDESRLEIGDGEFDHLVAVQGDECELRAILGAPMRASILARVERQALTVEGPVMSTLEAGHTGDARLIEDRVRGMIALAKSMTFEDESIPARLLDTAQKEPAAGVRRRAFQALFAHYSAHPTVRAALERLLEDADPLVRILAAQTQGEEGLLRIQAMAVDPAVADDLRVIAYCYLVQWARRRRDIHALIEEALGTESAHVAASVVRFIGQVRSSSFGPSVKTLLKKTRRGAVVLASMRALADLGLSEAERVIAAFLKATDHEIRMEAVAALTRVGTIISVQPLMELSSAILVDGTLRERAQQAVKVIRARIPYAESGSLSLADDGTAQGALSLPAESSGALSTLGLDDV